MTVKELVASFANLAEDVFISVEKYPFEQRVFNTIEALGCLDEIEWFAFFEGEPETPEHPYQRDALYIYVK